MHKVVSHEARGKHAKIIKMAAQQKERLSEAVQYPVLYIKADTGFKHKTKKQLAWKGVAKEANLENDVLFKTKILF